MRDTKDGHERGANDARDDEVSRAARSSLRRDVVAYAKAVPGAEDVREGVVGSLWYRRSPEDAARCEAAGVRSAEDLVALYREGAAVDDDGSHAVRSSLRRDVVALARAVPEAEDVRERVVRSLWYRRSPEDAARCEAAGVRSAEDLVSLYREGAAVASAPAADDGARDVSAAEAEEMLRTAAAIGATPHGCFEPLARTVVRLHDRLEERDAVLDGARRLPYAGEILAHEVAGGQWLVALSGPDEVVLRGVNVAFCDPRRVRSCVAVGADGRPCAWPTHETARERLDPLAAEIERSAADVGRSADALEAAALYAPPGPYVDDGYRLRAPPSGGDSGEMLWEYKGSEAEGAQGASQLAVAAREHALRVVIGWRRLRAAGEDVVEAVLGGEPPESVLAAARRLARQLGKAR